MSRVWRPYTAIVVNQNNQPLTIVWMATDRAPNTASWKGSVRPSATSSRPAARSG